MACFFLVILLYTMYIILFTGNIFNDNILIENNIWSEKYEEGYSRVFRF